MATIYKQQRQLLTWDRHNNVAGLKTENQLTIMTKAHSPFYYTMIICVEFSSIIQLKLSKPTHCPNVPNFCVQKRQAFGIHKLN